MESLRAVLGRATRRAFSLLAAAALVTGLLVANAPFSGAATSHAPVPMPDVVGKTRAEVFAIMAADQLFFATHGTGSNNGTWVRVIAQDPPPGTLVPYRSTVSLTVTAGVVHQPLPAPDLVGLTRAQVYNIMKSYQLYFTTTGPGSPTNSVVISTPGNGATITGAVHLLASASESQTVNQVQVWDNGVKLGYSYGTAVDAIYNLVPGKHTTTVLDQSETWKVLHQASVTYTVQALVDGLQVIAPSAGEIVNMTTVHVVAQANESVPINQMQVWDNGVKLGWYAGASVNQYFSLSPGSHTVTVLDQDNHYNLLHRTSVSYVVQ